MHFILGSQSPRRGEILNYFNLPFKQISSDFDEASIPFQGDPQAYVQALAKGKGSSLLSQFLSSLILTADTIVYREGKVYGKPKNEEEAFSYLKELAGQWHSVWTGVHVTLQDQAFQAAEETRVLFHLLTDEQIQAYHHAIPFMDKAGGYMIQGPGSLIVEIYRRDDYS